MSSACLIKPFQPQSIKHECIIARSNDFILIYYNVPTSSHLVQGELAWGWHYKEVSEKHLSRLIIFESDHHSWLTQMIYSMTPKGMGKSLLSQIHIGCQILGSGVCRMHSVSLPYVYKSSLGLQIFRPYVAFFAIFPWIIPSNQDGCNWTWFAEVLLWPANTFLYLFRRQFSKSWG